MLSVVPDLFLAAVVALLVTMAIRQLDGAEVARIQLDARAAADNGLTLDERIDVYDGSIRRSTLFQLPALIALSGALVGLTCRNRRWAWLTAIGSVLPRWPWRGPRCARNFCQRRFHSRRQPIE
jgi:hypothetical protein